MNFSVAENCFLTELLSLRYNKTKLCLIMSGSENLANHNKTKNNKHSSDKIRVFTRYRASPKNCLLCKNTMVRMVNPVRSSKN